MRYSLMALAVASTFTLAACNQTPNSNESNEPATSVQSTTAPTDTANVQSTDNVSMNITGAGASFPQPIYAKWSDAYNKATGGQVNYQSIGSSGGIKQIVAKTVDFGASDAPMTPAELNEAGLIQFPTVIGGVVPVVNIDGVAPG